MMLSVNDILKSISSLSFSSREMKEQEDSAAGDTSSGGGSTKSTGAKQWESGRKMGKTYGGPKYVWNSDRVMGKTYQGDPKYKWESGASRGKANPLT
jgi:hypothetical protein